MRYCRTCHLHPASDAWQPFGPNETPDESGAFTALGWHYRGFPIIPVCNDCHDAIIRHDVDRAFTVKREPYMYVAARRSVEHAPF